MPTKLWFRPTREPIHYGVREPTRVLGQLLLGDGAVSGEQLSNALREQRRTRERIGEILMRNGADPESVARALARQLRLPFAAAPLAPQRDALALVDRPVALRLRVVPLSLRDKAVSVAMADPLDITAIDDLQFRTGRRIEPAVATAQAVQQALAAYDVTEVAALLTRLPGGPVASQSEDELRKASEAPPVVALLDYLLERAVAARASDVHIEPLADRVLIRARVDGVLRELVTLPLHVAPALVSRVKVVANLDISIRRKPQDGRCSFRSNGDEIAARVSTLPSHHGEKIVLRLLATNTEVATLDALGMNEVMLARMRTMLRRTHGVFLVTGPTGSGKTSTLYAALSEMDGRSRNIVTLEDPIERRIDGVTQVQVNRRGGTTFARALRAVLRQDPDIILIGELRDRETVETALAAALTGHLVLSTLHTNDAPSAATRLIEMGAPPYLICGALIGVLAQRLARRLCVHCRTERSLAGREREELGGADVTSRIYEPAGCANCDRSGYRGRIGIFELMQIDSAARDLIMRRAPADALRAAAQAAGTELLAQDARQKVLGGLTSMEEAGPLILTHSVDQERLHKCKCGSRLDRQWGWCPACGARTIIVSADQSRHH
jgi:type II secretory ATPase GspE/PulE/Tfp pilus assembly ATPase PilB-like protein